ncbi:hypothetical protein EX30DRAFT_361641 [Ascodesmis nigricans]|uniref:DUF6594 domain-containing protein n=1 Tax=Ascodesmis nigricans TaxID=341454 RepID=A0A4S2N3A6_9PEZI|nr:hypothetical protein EX30DRAFT_361641 [Ascodesmis nigricans]
MTIGCNTTPSGSTTTPHSTPLYPPLPHLRPHLIREPSRYGYPFPTFISARPRSDGSGGPNGSSRDSGNQGGTRQDGSGEVRIRISGDEEGQDFKTSAWEANNEGTGGRGGDAKTPVFSYKSDEPEHQLPEYMETAETIMTARAMHAHRNLTVFRRFGHLSMLSLLTQQKELARLEEMLMRAEDVGVYYQAEGSSSINLESVDVKTRRKRTRRRRKLRKRRMGESLNIPTLTRSSSSSSSSSSSISPSLSPSPPLPSPPTRTDLLHSLHTHLKSYYESLLLQDAVFTTLEPPRNSDTHVLHTLTAPTSETIYTPQHHDDLVQLGTTNRDSLEKLLSRVVSRVFRRRRVDAATLRRRFWPWGGGGMVGNNTHGHSSRINIHNSRGGDIGGSTTPSTTSLSDITSISSPYTRRLTRLVVALSTAALMLGPMAILKFVVDERWRLVWIAGFTVVLSVGVAFATGGRRGGGGGAEGVVVVVAAYAAVLVVFVEQEGRRER